MQRAFIERLRVQNYGCAKNVDVALTPLHAFVGPNDSGKSTLLRALETLAGVWDSRNWASDERRRYLERAFSANGAPALENCELEVQSLRSSYLLRIGADTGGHLVGLRGGPQFLPASFAPGDDFASKSSPSSIHDALAGCQALRPDPDAIRMNSPLIAPSVQLRLLDERGRGLAGLLDGIRDRNEEGFGQIREEFSKLFSNVRQLQLKTVNSGEKNLQIVLHDGTEVPAAQMSEGMLYYLVIAATARVRSTSILLLEEPENGLHPARILDLMRVLRAASVHMQILLATQSPLVLNELEPAEVTVLTRDRDRGTVATPIASTPNFAERARVYRLGELWVSYANGVDEAPLFKPPDPQADSGPERDWPEAAD